MQEYIIHAFGHVHPSSDALQDAARSTLDSWGIPPCLELDSDMLRFDHEGVFFPHEDLVAALTPHLTCRMSGRIDIIDREAWTLTRYVIDGSRLSLRTAGLNQVLAYSGF